VKIVATIARYLQGLIFLVFGLNKFFNFIPSGPLPGGVAGEFIGAMVASKYIMLVGLFEVVGGLLLLINRYVPMALALLAPVIVNVLAVNILLDHRGLPSGIVITILWVLVYVRVKAAFSGLYSPLPQH